MNYFLDERDTKNLFIDLFIGKRLNNRPINDRRFVILSHLEMYLIEEKEKVLIELAKASAKGKTIRELNNIAKGTQDETL